MHFFLFAVAPPIAPSPIGLRFQSLLGLVAFTFLAFLIGRLRGVKTIPWRVILWGTVLQFAFGAIVLFSPAVLQSVQFAIQKLLDYSIDGGRLVFGSLVDRAFPVTPPAPAADGKPIGIAQLGVVLSLIILPTIVFVSMLTAMLYHIGILGRVVYGLAWVMRKTTGLSGAETLSTAANIFVGQTEAPLLIRPFIGSVTSSEMMVIMVGGFANIASGVLAYYNFLLAPFVPDAGAHLALACFISAPATLVVSKLFLPERDVPVTAGGVDFRVEKVDTNLIDAASRGTSEGFTLALNVIAMLIAFTALIALLNGLFGWVTGLVHLGGTTIVDGQTVYAGLNIQQVLGYIGAPAAWLCGVPWSDATKVGTLLGLKTALNEAVAYQAMNAELTKNPAWLSPRSALLALYAVCGFANFASVGIQIGGISVLAPNKRAELARLGLIAMLGGAIATCMGACIVGVLI